MKIRLAVCALLSGVLAACSPGSAPGGAESKISESKVIDTANPFAFLPWNSDNPAVQKTGSGVEYVVIESGDADGNSPIAPNSVVVHYEGHLAATNEKFDSSYDRGSPATFQAGALIPGFTEALLNMKPGDDWLVFIPSALGYGERGTPTGSIPPNSDLVFRINLKEIIAADETAWSKYRPWPEDAPEVKSTESGLKYVVLKEGDQTADSPRAQDLAVVHYEGRFVESGETFDSSFMRGQPERFPVGGLIPGWTEALQLMKPGDRWMLYVPSDLAYGENGAGDVIPPNADLQFEMQLIFVMPLGDD